MSTIYVLEPPTKGKVVVTTSYGPLDIELWPKEAPKAVRNFVQLCLEGLYDNTIFHRIMKGFLVQGGDPTGTGTGGESIYGDVFGDEFHSRLRFKHRGLVACANAGSPNSNGSQFFVTLDRCDWLDKKHTIFGKVTGDSIYNLTRLGEVETDQDDRPLDPPPKILSVEVLWNPFDDIVPRVPVKSLASQSNDTDKKDVKKKAIKKLSLLSFGEEAEQEEKELAAVKRKIKSSHDVLDDPRLLRESVPGDISDPETKTTKDVHLSIREALNSKSEEFRRNRDAEFSENDDVDEESFDARMRQQILRKRNELGDTPAPPKPKALNDNSKPKQREVSPSRSDSEKDGDQPRRGKLSMNKRGIGSEARAERIVNTDVDLQLLNESEKGRRLQKQKKRRLQGREDEVLAKLAGFKAKVFEKPAESCTDSEAKGKSEDLSDWTKASLKFEVNKDGMSRKDDPNDYVLVDPLLEKGKEKFNKMQAKQKRREREWAGRSLT